METLNRNNLDINIKVDRLAVLVAVRRVLGMGVVDSRSLRYGNYVRMQHFVRRTTFVPFSAFLGGCAT
jgi:hypothetical protein